MHVTVWKDYIMSNISIDEKMAILSREELMAKLSAKIGDDTSDEAIALTEDISDTFADLESKANGDGVDWKAEATRIDEE